MPFKVWGLMFTYHYVFLHSYTNHEPERSHVIANINWYSNKKSLVTQCPGLNPIPEATVVKGAFGIRLCLPSAL